MEKQPDMRTVFSIFVWMYYSFCMILFFGLITISYLIIFPFDRYLKFPNRIVKILGKLMMYFNPFWKFTIRGVEKYNRDRPTIFIANHQSFLDLPLLYLLPWTMKWVTKKSLLYIPILGWIIRMTGHLSIDRSKKTAVNRLHNLVQPLQDNVPVMIFPEGTRTPDGNLQSFKNGAFLLAYEHNFAIQPIVIYGPYQVQPTGEWRFQMKQHFVVSVLDAVDPSSFEKMDKLKQYCHSLIAEELERIHDSVE